MLLVSTAVSLLNAALAESVLRLSDIAGADSREPAIVLLEPGELQAALDEVRYNSGNMTEQYIKAISFDIGWSTLRGHSPSTQGTPRPCRQRSSRDPIAALDLLKVFPTTNPHPVFAPSEQHPCRFHRKHVKPAPGCDDCTVARPYQEIHFA